MTTRKNGLPPSDAFLRRLHRVLESQFTLHHDTDVQPKDIDAMGGPHLHKNWEIKFTLPRNGADCCKIILTPPGVVHQTARRDFSMEIADRSVFHSTDHPGMFQNRALSDKAARLNRVPDILRAALAMAADERCRAIGHDLVRSAIRLIVNLLAMSENAPDTKDHRSVVQSAMEYMEKTYYQATLRVSDVAGAAGVSGQYLNRLFRRETGKTLRQALIEIRLAHARELMRSRKYLVKSVASLTGWHSPFYFCSCYRRHFGVTPRGDAR